MNIIKQFYLPVRQTIITIIVCLAVVAGVSLVFAWTGPTENPPGGNVPAPINVGALPQIKSGALQVNGLRNLGATILDGNVGIGTESPSRKLDVAGFVKGQSGLCIGNDCRNSWPAGGGSLSCTTVTCDSDYNCTATCPADHVVIGCSHYGTQVINYGKVGVSYFSGNGCTGGSFDNDTRITIQARCCKIQ